MAKIAYNRFLPWLCFLFVFADFLFLFLHPSYRNYKATAARVDAKLAEWDAGFRSEYIDEISKIGVALTSVVHSVSSPSPSSSAHSRVIELPNYRYWSCGSSSGFSWGNLGDYVYVGDMFAGCLVVRADRYGASLSDGTLIVRKDSYSVKNSEVKNDDK